MNTDPKKPYSCHESSTTAFQVEVRCTTVSQHMPVVLQDGLVTESWREVHFSKGMNPGGVPIEDLGRFNTLMPYESALALAWTIIAQHRHSVGIQCRIVAYKHTEKVRLDYIGPMSSLDASDTQQGLPDPNDGGETDGIIKPTFGAYRYARRAQEKIAAEAKREREAKNGTTGTAEDLRKRKEACDTASAKAEAKSWNTPTPEALGVKPNTTIPAYGSPEWLEEFTTHCDRLQAAVAELTPEQRMKHGLPSGTEFRMRERRRGRSGLAGIPDELL